MAQRGIPKVLVCCLSGELRIGSDSMNLTEKEADMMSLRMTSRASDCGNNLLRKARYWDQARNCAKISDSSFYLVIKENQWPVCSEMGW